MIPFEKAEDASGIPILVISALIGPDTSSQ
jgi:hypothetical protein